MLTYASYIVALSELLVIDPTNDSFLAILPDCIDQAEQRLYRELNLLATVVRDSTQALTPNSRDFSLPTSQGVFVVTNAINVITPAGAQPANGTRNPLTPVSLNFLDAAYPSAIVTGLPTYFAMVTQTAVVVGPFPGDAYVVEVIGTQRPLPMSADNPQTLLSTYLPDLFLSASMVFMSAYQKNFGSQSDNPQTAMSWEKNYQTLFASADQEEFRKRFMGSAWSSMTQGPAAQPARS